MILGQDFGTSMKLCNILSNQLHVSACNRSCSPSGPSAPSRPALSPASS